MESAHILDPMSRLVFGTMLLTESDEGVLDEYVGLGGNAIDTARVYGDGDSERALGEWLSQQPSSVRERLVIVSKGAHPNGARKRVTPEEIGELVLFMCSDACQFMTADTVYVNGGGGWR